ncbi:MAG: hypothetical protein K2H88_02320 [Duncaniella sp.]|nr:hypothetical protein [Duncaniella sp.]MDE5919126.1 hypothetical protein [Duncaniella sp.]MDE6170197.1 hypothetical protein [Duncaniella sp.]
MSFPPIDITSGERKALLLLLAVLVVAATLMWCADSGTSVAAPSPGAVAGDTVVPAVRTVSSDTAVGRKKKRSRKPSRHKAAPPPSRSPLDQPVSD